MAAMNSTQLLALAAHIRANDDAEVVAALASRNDTELVRLYSLGSAFIVWRKNIQPDEYREALDWTEIDNLTVGRARIWEWVTQGMTVAIDASKTNIRAGLNNAFNSSNNSKAALIIVAKRPATVFESVFVTGTGTDASPGDLVVSGVVTIKDMGRALNA